MNSQVLHTVWCHISGEAAGEFWHWSLSGVKGLNEPFPWLPAVTVLTAVSFGRFSASSNGPDRSGSNPELDSSGGDDWADRHEYHAPGRRALHAVRADQWRVRVLGRRWPCQTGADAAVPRGQRQPMDIHVQAEHTCAFAWREEWPVFELLQVWKGKRLEGNSLSKLLTDQLSTSTKSLTDLLASWHWVTDWPTERLTGQLRLTSWRIDWHRLSE